MIFVRCIVTALLASASLAACDGDPPEDCFGLPDDHPDWRTATVDLVHDPDIDDAALASGFDYWKPKCLRHRRAASGEEADVTIVPDRGPCQVNPETNGFIMAQAYDGGLIEVHLDCFLRSRPSEPDGRVSRDLLRLVLAHEIGHQAGLWGHVPVFCGQVKPASDFERSLDRAGICGDALMNPMIDRDFRIITDLDARAYDLRDKEQAATPSLRAAAPPGCVLSFAPAP